MKQKSKFECFQFAIRPDPRRYICNTHSKKQAQRPEKPQIAAPAEIIEQKKRMAEQIY
jgi:hypothetical protein